MSPELAFGTLARRLEVRSLGAPADEVRLLYAPRELPAEARQLLQELPEASLRPAGELELLAAPVAVLRPAAGDHPVLRILLQAHENAVAPRRAPRLMGIVNVTPDSFSDGGRFADPGSAIEHGLKLVAEGAEILDVGGESTRPGAASVSEAEEMRRVLPVIEELAGSTSASISVDTRKSEVARRALDAGASLVNDVSAGRHDPRMLDVVAERDAGVVLMHMQGTPRDMQRAPAYADVVREVTAHLRERTAAGLKAGIGVSRIMIDPGIGFGKRVQDNLDLIRGLPELRSLGLPLVLGVSRKAFLGRLSGEEDPARRDRESLAALSIGHFLGADVHRVHDVGGASSALAIAGALAASEGDGS